jgi:hypothetical protein
MLRRMNACCQSERQAGLRPQRAPNTAMGSWCPMPFHLLKIYSNWNQNSRGSLEAVMQKDNTAARLPVLTIGEPQCIPTSRAYAHRVLERPVEYLVLFLLLIL